MNEQQTPEVAFDDPEADQAFAQAQHLASLMPGESKQKLTTLIPFDQLVESSRFQIRQALTEVFVRRYMAAYEVGADMPPIEVAVVTGPNGKPGYYLCDGFHRVAALKRLGRTEAYAVIYSLPSLNDVQWLGWQKNQHGVHYTKDERIAAFKLYLTMGQHLFRPRPNAQRQLKSIRQIAKEWFKSPDAIWKMIQKVNPRLAAEYRKKNRGREGRPAGEGNLPARQLMPLDVARHDLKNVLNVAKTATPPQQQQIVQAAETMVERLKHLETQGDAEPVWSPVEEDF